MIIVQLCSAVSAAFSRSEGSLSAVCFFLLKNTNFMCQTVLTVIGVSPTRFPFGPHTFAAENDRLAVFVFFFVCTGYTTAAKDCYFFPPRVMIDLI